MLTHVPTRTCVGCRKKSSRTDLIRLVCDADQRVVSVDRFGRLPGRGAWVHPDESCILSAFSPGRLQRAMRGPVSIDGETLREALDLLR